MRNFFLIILLIPFGLFAQEFRRCPSFDANETWESSESFVKNAEIIQDLMDWLINTPPSEQLVERSAANIFVMEWVTKNPNIQVQVEVGPYSEFLYTEDLLLAYLYGNINYKLKHEGKEKPEPQRVSGLKALVFVIEHSEAYSDNKIFKHLLRAYRKGELIEFDKEMWLNQRPSGLLNSDTNK